VSEPLWRKSATQLAALIARRDVSSREVVAAHLARIAEVDPHINAMPVVLERSALAGADAADRAIKRGERGGPLRGVPLSIKTNIDLVGQPTTHGVPMLANAMPAQDHPIVERMKAAGAIPIGRTNMPDMGLRLHTDSALYGLTRNPWNLARTVGGSSGGEAAALATGMSPLGLGNDIGGSLRNPAFCCGVASLKPSFGRIPHASSLEPASGSLVAQMMAVQGPMARTVADLRVALAIVAGPHPRDPLSYPAPLDAPAPQIPVRVALVPHPPGGTTAPALRDAVKRAGTALAAAGYRVDEVAPPMVEDAIQTWGRWLSWEFGVLREQLTGAMSPDAKAFFGAFMDLFGPATYADSVMLMIKRHQIARAWSEFFAEYPLIVGPTWCEPQFEHGYDVANARSAADVVNLMRFVTPMNLLGLPVVCVPTGVAAGLPTGVQVIGDRFREDLCLAAGSAIETALGRITPIDVVVA
jgi:amidase